jgi:glycosyltransferase involved in cell wall biosynthesis
MGILCRGRDTSRMINAVSSILNQSYDNIELLINDDGSDEAVKSALDKLANRDTRILLLREGSRFTLPQKLNWCLKYAKGQYVARMDDDDFSYPDRFEKQTAFLDSNNDIAFVGCNVRLIREGETVGFRTLPQFPKKEDFRFVQPFIHPALMFRKEALDSTGGYSEGKWQILCEDYDLLLRLYQKNFLGCNLQETLLDYSIPSIGKTNRKYHHRINEAVTRFYRFRDLGMLPGAFPYVFKPLVAGLIPTPILDRIRFKRNEKI